MMMKNPHLSRPHFLSGAAAFGFATLLLSLPALAASVTWDGGPTGLDTVLETPANWAGDALPAVNGDTMVWDGTAGGGGALALTYGAGLGGGPGNSGLNINLTPGQTGAFSLNGGTSGIRLNGVQIDAGAGAFTFGSTSGTFGVTLGGFGGVIHSWINNSANTATINSNVSFGLGGGGNHALLFGGSGNWNVSTALTPANAANLSLHKTGTGELTLANGGTWVAGVNSYGGSFAGLFKEGTTRMTGGTYTATAGEIVVGGLDTVGTNTKLMLSNSAAITGLTWLSIGRGNGTGVTSSDLTLNNSSSIATTNISVGYNANNGSTAPKGNITLNDSSTINATGGIYLGESATSSATVNVNGTSTFKQSGAASGETRLGQGDNSTGTVNVNGGTASFERDLIIGYAGSGKGGLTLTSGTVNVASTSERWVKFNAGTTGSALLEVNGGNLNLNTNTDIRYSTGANTAGSAVVNLNGGAITGYAGNAAGGFSGGSVVDLQTSGTAAVNNAFNLNGGTLTIGQVISTANTGTAAFNFNGGTLKAAAASANFVDLGGANQKVNVKDGGAVVDSNGFDITIVDPMLNGGTGGLTKQGAGNLTLPATSTYVGETKVNGGKLTVNGNIASSLVTTVNATGALGGSGTVGSLVAKSGGTVSPGNSPGILTAGNTSLESDSILSIELNGAVAGSGYDQLIVNGSVSLAGTLSVSLGFTPADAALFFIIPNDAADAVSGTFSGLADGSIFTVGSQSFQIGYTGDSVGNTFTGGNDVVLKAIPEPGSLMLGALGLAMVLRRRRVAGAGR